MILQGEELEFAISQYLDGTLSAEVMADVEERLAVDARARDLLREYRQLGTTIRENLPELPTVDFSNFSSSILLANQWATDGQPAVNLRRSDRWVIGNLVGTIGAQPTFRRLALAASVLIACTMVAVFVAKPKVVAPLAEVAGPRVEQSTGPVIAQVSIGPAPSVASGSRLSHEDVVDRPSIVLIDRADNPAPDNDSIY